MRKIFANGDLEDAPCAASSSTANRHSLTWRPRADQWYTGLMPITRTTTEAELRAATIGEPQVLDGPIPLREYDPNWPALFEREAARIRAALGDRVLGLEHVGSTSVPGLAAKAVIDMLLIVEDSGDESAYVPPMEAAGYVLRNREPGWYQHRLFKGPDTDINLHVLSRGCPEIRRMVGFRDHLRSNADDRQLYEKTKRELAQRKWKYVQNYADAKTAVVEEIVARALRPKK